MTFAFLMIGLAALLLDGGITARNLKEVLSGDPAPDEPKRPEDDPLLANITQDTSSGVGSVVDAAGGVASATAAGGAWAGTKAVVQVAIKIGKSHGLHVISTKRATKNTASGGVSDHWVGSKAAYAADQSNGSHPTPQMDATAAEIAKTFGMDWSGSGVSDKVLPGGVFRVQMLYRTNVGGNHFNHVHFGCRNLKES